MAKREPKEHENLDDESLPTGSNEDEESSIIEFSEDIGEAEAPPPLPKADYPAEIREVKRALSKQGNAYAAVSFYISPDDYPADYPVENDPDGKTIIYRRVPLEDTKRARFQLRRFCEAIGAPMPAKRLNLDDWIGARAVLQIGHDTYEGITRENIERVKPA